MKKFEFSQDVKQTIWKRNTFHIEANTLQDAIKMIVDMELHNNLISDTEIDHTTCHLFGTSENLLPSENYGCTTMEVLHDNKTIFNNTLPKHVYVGAKVKYKNKNYTVTTVAEHNVVIENSTSIIPISINELVHYEK